MEPGSSLPHSQQPSTFSIPSIIKSSSTNKINTIKVWMQKHRTLERKATFQALYMATTQWPLHCYMPKNHGLYEIYNSKLIDWLVYSFILLSVLRQVHNLLQSEFVAECDLVLPLSISSINNNNSNNTVQLPTRIGSLKVPLLHCNGRQPLNLLNTKHKLLYLKIQFVARSNHFSSRL
jgi:hypothetical protein